MKFSLRLSIGVMAIFFILGFTTMPIYAQPDTTIDNFPPNPSNSSSASFTFSSTETGSTFECLLDGGVFTSCTSPQDYTGLPEGAHTFSVRAIFPEGNPDPTPATYSWTIDTTAPDTSITSTPSNPSDSSSPSFSFTATETDSTFECKLDQAPAFTTCASPQSYSALSDGSHTFQVRALDQAGNLDPTPSSYTWTIDTTPPDTSLTSTPSNPSNTSSPSFSFTGTETGSTFECQLDGGGFEVCTSPKSYSDLSDGSHTFEVRAIDSLGNTDPSPASYSWAIDAAEPYTTLNGDWMMHPIRGPYNDKGAAHFTFDGPRISGYGFLFSLGQTFFIEQNSQVTIDYTNRKIEGSFNVVTSGTSPTKLGKFTIDEGTFNKNFTKLTLKIDFQQEGVISPLRLTFSGYRFDPADPDIVNVPNGFTINAKITGRDVEGDPLTVIVEPSSLGDRLGIMSGGGDCKYNELPFKLSISESLYFLTDKGEIFGEFNSNLFATVMRGEVTSSQKGPKFNFKPMLTVYAKRAKVVGFAEEEIPTPPTQVSPENNATNVATNPTFTWTPSSDESVTYGLQVSTSTTFSSTAVNKSGLTGTSYNATGLLNNRKYYWRMNTTKMGVVSDWSSVWNFTTSAGN